jgi:hypothetical protein
MKPFVHLFIVPPDSVIAWPYGFPCEPVRAGIDGVPIGKVTPIAGGSCDADVEQCRQPQPVVIGQVDHR